MPQSEWTKPKALQDDGYIDESKMPKNSKYSQLVILGNKILNETTYHVGPQAKDPKKRFAGNNLSCSSCHALGGSMPNHAGFVGIYGRYPQHSPRSDAVVTLEERINGCFERSMNGRKMPIDSKEMKAMVAYMHWISQGIPVGAKTKGQGVGRVAFLSRSADPKKGKVVYLEKCAACHQENGLGVKNKERKGGYYLYPPLWGKDSYNTGAGMYRLIKATSYIKTNMPLGNPTLTLEEAYDVASYINSQKRPIKKNREKDFPDKRIKPLDMDTGSYDDPFPTTQHKYGPYDKMQK